MNVTGDRIPVFVLAWQTTNRTEFGHAFRFTVSLLWLVFARHYVLHTEAFARSRVDLARSVVFYFIRSSAPLAMWRSKSREDGQIEPGVKVV